MKVSIEELKTLTGYRFSTPFNEKLDGVDAIKPVLGEITVTWNGSGMLLTGQVKTLLKLECNTCLRPYFQQVTIELDEKFVDREFLGDAPELVQRELHSDDFVETLPADGVLDITDVVYQAVTLATPTYPSCGAECPGPPDGAEGADAPDSADRSAGKHGAKNSKPLDPRWKNLKTLFPNEESRENS